LLKKALSHTLIYALGPQFPRVISILLMPLITPYLTPSDYGIHGLIIAYMAAFAALKDLGLTTILSNTYYKTRWRYKLIWSRLYAFLSLWSIVLGIILFGLLFLIIPEAAEKNYFVIGFLYCVPIVFFDTTILFGARYFHLAQKPQSFVLISIIGSLVTIGATYYTIVHLNFGYLGWFIAVFCERITTFIIYFYLLIWKRKITFKLDFKLKWLLPYFVIALPTLPHFYSTYILDSSDRLILDFYNVDIVQIGRYNIGYGFGQYFSILNVAVGLSLGAIYLELFAKKTLQSEYQARNMTWALQFIVLCFGLFLCLWMKEIFKILVKNEELKNAYDITIIIIMRYAGVIIYHAAINKLIFLEKTKVLWRITFLAGLINVVLNIIFIPRYGIMAAVVTTLVAGLYMGYVGFFLSDFKQNNNVRYRPILVLSIVITTTFLVYLARDLSVSYKVLLTSTSLIIGAVIFVGFRDKFIKLVN
jgi:O-antigen/teichoic acid export membrane protein